MDLVATLEELSNLCALSGHEEPVIGYMKERLAPFADSLSVDNLGNVTCVIRGSGDSLAPAMVFAHMDEVGLMVKKVESDGYLRFVRVGGIPERVLQGQRVILTGKKGLLPGVIGAKSHHVTQADEKYKVVPFQDCYVDIGARSKAEVTAMGIHVGTPVTYAPGFARLPGGRIVGKAMDNRAGCLALLALAERLSRERAKIDVAVVATVQEEFNIRGALPSAYALNPVLGICLDVAVAHDTPDLKNDADLSVGDGPAVGHYSFHGRGTLGGLIPHPALRSGVEATAERLGISFQRNVFFGGLADSSFLQLVREGIPAVDIGVPCRYTHSPVETIHLADLESMIHLVFQYLQELPARPSFRRG
ncbi:MAG: M42 family metallopeptidase [Firmicutes bacterium]|nr:M42 family metallopeptidase [Bacillota bacterium]